MSVLVTVKMNGDTDAFVDAIKNRGDEFAAFGERARVESGAIHHRFGVGDGFVLVVDEWETAEQFETFFSDPKLQAFIATVGGDTSAPPDITVTEAIESADQY
jgi:quinol monooxygenase YgiN